MSVAVTNIKFSFKSKLDVNKDIFISNPKIKCYTKNNNFVIRHYKTVFSLLGRCSRHINCTGIKNLKQLRQSILFFSFFSKIDVADFFSIKIDCLTLKIYIKKNIKNLFFEKRSSFFQVLKTSRFPATILKLRLLNRKISCLYFNEKGVLLIIGLQKVKYAHFVIGLLKSEYHF